MRRACPSCGSLETVIVDNRANKLLAVLDWPIYLVVSFVAVVITLWFWVPDSDMLPVARKCRECGEIFVRRKAKGRDGRCRRCDYDLTGNISGTCPECGTPVDPSTVASPSD